MFRGVNNINLDDKGRMAMPARYRELLRLDGTHEVVITIDTEERCLLLYPISEWEVIEKKIEQLPSFNRAARRVQRLLIGHATEVNLDSHGRVLLPQPLREYAQLDKHIVLVGQGKKFEIWNEQHWTNQRETWLNVDESMLSALPEDLQELSL